MSDTKVPNRPGTTYCSTHHLFPRPVIVNNLSHQILQHRLPQPRHHILILNVLLQLRITIHGLQHNVPAVAGPKVPQHGDSQPDAASQVRRRAGSGLGKDNVPDAFPLSRLAETRLLRPAQLLPLSLVEPLHLDPFAALAGAKAMMPVPVRGPGKNPTAVATVRGQQVVPTQMAPDGADGPKVVLFHATAVRLWVGNVKRTSQMKETARTGNNNKVRVALVLGLNV